jgi:hypothetical protein
MNLLDKRIGPIAKGSLIYEASSIIQKSNFKFKNK